MLTFTQIYTETCDAAGILLPDTVNVNYIKRNINNGLKLMKADARRYFTEKWKTADLQESQQSYMLPADSIRPTTVRINNGSLVFPIGFIESEDSWNSLNIIPQFSVFYPQKAFVRGPNEIEVWPIPSELLTGGIILGYEARMADMYLDDTVGLTIGVTQGSQTITCAAGGFLPTMVGMGFTVTDGTDGNWYTILSVTNDTTAILDNFYIGTTTTTALTLIGTVPDIPEAYHQALQFYALSIFHLFKRGNTNKSNEFDGKYQVLHDSYVGAYGAKETSLVLEPQGDIVPYNPLLVPPNGTLTG